MKLPFYQLFSQRRVWLLIIGMAGLAVLPSRAATNWVDISTPLVTRLTNSSGAKAAWPGGCSGVVVNRTNGEVTIKVVGFGLWRSSDQGNNWRRVDGDAISGRDETGWATSVDQNAPGRMASFSLDGTAGWTSDGVNWKKFASLGRNWDFGSVDWASPAPQIILGAKHETSPPGEVYLTQDGGVTWQQLPIHLAGKSDRLSMLGVMAATTFIYSKDEGIHRSQDMGKTWEKVSAVNAQTRIPVLFRKAHYLGTTNGLLVSKDLGATWQPQGAAVNIWQGPFFGRDAQEMLVVGKDGAFLTRNAGAEWTKVAALKTGSRGFSFNPNWFGCYAWETSSTCRSWEIRFTGWNFERVKARERIPGVPAGGRSGVRRYPAARDHIGQHPSAVTNARFASQTARSSRAGNRVGRRSGGLPSAARRSRPPTEACRSRWRTG